MGPGEAPPTQVAAPLVARLRAELGSRHRRGASPDGGGPIVVGFDGRSGSGKSTVAAAVAEVLARGDDGHEPVPVTVIEGDSFYAGGTAARWDRRTPAENADLVIDWRRQRTILQALHEGRAATWHPFDWESDRWDHEPAPLAARPVTVEPAAVVLLEGAYSCRPELADLVDLRVLLEVPRDLRRRRLLDREGDDHDAAWDERWAAAEDHYFGHVATTEAFDLVLTPS